MIYYLKLYFASLVVFFAVNMVWLGMVDLVLGMVLSTIVSISGFYVAKWL